MSRISVIALGAMLLSIVPFPTAQAYSCDQFSQSRTLGGNVITVTLRNCEDYYSYGTYTSDWRGNSTTVSVQSTSGYYVELQAWNSWNYQQDPSVPFSAESRSHSYGVYVQDTTFTQPVNHMSVGASDNRYEQSTYGCNEQVYTGGYAGTTEGYVGGSTGHYMGDSKALPCTSRDVQEALP